MHDERHAAAADNYYEGPITGTGAIGWVCVRVLHVCLLCTCALLVHLQDVCPCKMACCVQLRLRFSALRAVAVATGALSPLSYEGAHEKLCCMATTNALSTSHAGNCTKQCSHTLNATDKKRAIHNSEPVCGMCACICAYTIRYEEQRGAADCALNMYTVDVGIMSIEGHARSSKPRLHDDPRAAGDHMGTRGMMIHACNARAEAG